MIADYADKLNSYEEFKDYADMVQQFIKRQKEENLPEGRYDLENGIFALVQKYTTKPLEGAQMESHKKYCDLQYIVEGTEKIYWASLRKLIVEDDRTPEAIRRYQERGLRPVLDIYLNLLNAFARSANSAKVSASPLTFTGIPVSAIAFSISSFEKSSSWEFFSPFTNVFLL